ncbi:MAG TPA: hypothetical protein VNT22_06895, partial [Baekduia sp.]|nr:hypothetical protein [Baekduia sp.]
MAPVIRSRLGSYLFMVALAAVFPAATIHFLMAEGNAPVTGPEHLGLVAFASSVAGIASACLLWSGTRSRDAHAVMSGAAFAAMSLLLLIHGLATPGVIVDSNPLIGFAGGVALPVGGALLALTAIPALRAPHRVKTVSIALVGLLSLIVVGGAVGFMFPSRVPQMPKSGDQSAIVLMIAGLIF